MAVKGLIVRLRKNIVFFLLLLIVKLMCLPAYDVDGHDIHS